jgi:hypothetical protein
MKLDNRFARMVAVFFTAGPGGSAANILLMWSAAPLIAVIAVFVVAWYWGVL